MKTIMKTREGGGAEAGDYHRSIRETRGKWEATNRMCSPVRSAAIAGGLRPVVILTTTLCARQARGEENCGYPLSLAAALDLTLLSHGPAVIPILW
jgi:hypothetical protein